MTTPSPAGGSAELPAGIAEALEHEQSAYLNAFNTLMAEFFAAQRELLEGISSPGWRPSNPFLPAASVCVPC